MMRDSRANAMRLQTSHACFYARSLLWGGQSKFEFIPSPRKVVTGGWALCAIMGGSL